MAEKTNGGKIIRVFDFETRSKFCEQNFFHYVVFVLPAGTKRKKDHDSFLLIFSLTVWRGRDVGDEQSARMFSSSRDDFKYAGLSFRGCRNAFGITQDQGNHDLMIIRQADDGSEIRVFYILPETNPAGPQPSRCRREHEVAGREGAVLNAPEGGSGTGDIHQARGVVIYIVCFIPER